MIVNLYLKGVIFALLGGIFWGFSGACGQYLFTHQNIDPQWLVSVRLLCSGIFLMIVLFLKKRGDIFEILKSKKSLLQLLIYAILGLMLCQYTYFVAIKFSNAAIATVLQYTAPAFIMIIVCFYERKLPTRKEIFALSCAVVGVFLLSTHGDFDKFVVSKNALIAGLISAVCIVIYSIAPIQINKKYGTTVSLAFGLLIGGISIGAFSQFWTQTPVSGLDGFLALSGVIFFGTVLAFWFYMVGLNIIGPTRASLLASIEPISAAVFAYFWFGTRFMFVDYFGFFLILFCTILLAKK